MSKRPTDHLEPEAKKRKNDRQLTKDDASDDEDEEEQAGKFLRAPEEVLKTRRIVKARRGGDAAPAAGAPAPASSNPFANISLVVPSSTPGEAIAPAPASEPKQTGGPELKKAPQEPGAAPPIEGPAGATPSGQAAPELEAADGEEDKAEEAHADDDGGTGESKSDATKPKEGSAPTPAPATTSGFTSFAASTSAPFALAASAAPTFSFGGGGGFGGLSGGSFGGGGFGGAGFGAGNGSAIGKIGTGFGTITGNTVQTGDGAPATAQPFSFSTSTSSAPSFSFATPPASGSFPALQTVFGTTSGSGANALFGSGLSSSAVAAPKLALPEEQKTVTGEEEEHSVFTSEGTLFQLEGGSWKERGRGEMRVNIAPSGKARLVMRQRGNLRLLLNANLWPDMKVVPMDGGKGVTFAVINAAKNLDEGAKEGEGEEDKRLLTYALRIKVASKLAEFTQAVKQHAAGGS